MKVSRAYIGKYGDVSLEVDYETDIDFKEDIEDESARDWIREQFQMGNKWAWCSVTVEVNFYGLIGRASLGACSYESEAAFKNCTYYQQLIDDAAHDIAKELERMSNEHGLWEHDESTCLRCVASWKLLA